MQVTRLWTPEGTIELDGATDGCRRTPAAPRSRHAMAACNNASLGDGVRRATRPSWRCFAPRQRLGQAPSRRSASAAVARQFRFDPALKLMSTVDERDGALWVHAKGAPEAVLARCDRRWSGRGAGRRP